MDQIAIRGARRHNLKDVSLDLPRLRLTVITGVSGSGKSSLAFDTLFAEGQRRYMESLSTYARQLLQKLDAPEVDEIRGLSPAIAIAQKGPPRNPRSTVGTLTEIHDHLRLLYARLGTVYCPECNRPVRAYTVAQMVRETLDWPPGSRLLILAPLGAVKAGALPGLMAKLRRDGYMRLRIDGRIFELDPPPHIPRRPSHAVEVVVDRLISSGEKAQRLGDALELATRVGGGSARVFRMEGGEKSFSEDFRCDGCGQKMEEPTPSLFSFHHPSGACPACGGLGFTPPGAAEAIPVSGKGTGAGQATAPGPQPPTPTKAPESSNPGLQAGKPAGALNTILPIDGEDEAFLEEDLPAVSAPGAMVPCPRCLGSRLNEAARSVRLGSLGIHEASRLPLPGLRGWLSGLDLSPSEVEIARRPARQILQRLEMLEELGLPYLSLDRPVSSLSGGEAQRIRLSNQLGAPLSGILYVLDEPSVGLHPRDHGRLLELLFRLRDLGNTVIVVEHDAQTILRADYVVDMGPGAGTLGGRVIFAGPPEELLRHPESLTGLYLSGRRTIAVSTRRPPFQQGALRVLGAAGNNLKALDVDFPLGRLICVTGVSGSGKSTLVLDTLYRALARRLYRSQTPPAPFGGLEGDDAIGKVIHVDQSPLGRTPRSNPATHTGIFSLVRLLYARLPEARARGYTASRFSFNVKGGRCEVCKGEGLQRIDMLFLPDVYVTCPACLGERYGRQALDIVFKGKSIAQVLRMTVHQASAFFENQPLLREKLEILREVGLGYLQLGQPATTLSGGEAQRVKLARELGRKARVKALYILDEPTTGLHFDDIEKLLHVLQRLVDAGHTVILIEHHPDVIKTADYVIDLGPEGGEGGGFLVAAGSPEEVAAAPASHTGRYLREALGKS
jgi:excinuclease ABC subunit A